VEKTGYDRNTKRNIKIETYEMKMKRETTKWNEKQKKKN
jgi:hypothetical protein